MRLVTTLLSFFLAVPSMAATTRMVTEGVHTTNKALYVSASADIYVKAGGTLTVSGNAFSVGGSSFTVNAGSVAVAYNLSVGSTATITGLSLYIGSGAFGRTGSWSNGVTNALFNCWNMTFSEIRDNTGYLGGCSDIIDGGIFRWKTNTDYIMYLAPGADNQGHLSLGWGNSSPKTVSNQIRTDFTISTREGALHGYNTSGNSLASAQAISIEDDSRAGIMLNRTSGSGRAWNIDSAYDGKLVITDAGPVGGGGGFGELVSISSQGVSFSSSTTSSVKPCQGGAYQTLPTSGWNEGCEIYQVSDHKKYIATETVKAASSWVPLW